MIAERRRFSRSNSTLLSGESGSAANGGEPGSCWEELIKFVMHLARKSRRRLIQHYYRFMEARRIARLQKANKQPSPPGAAAAAAAAAAGAVAGEDEDEDEANNIMPRSVSQNAATIGEAAAVTTTTTTTVPICNDASHTLHQDYQQLFKQHGYLDPSSACTSAAHLHHLQLNFLLNNYTSLTKSGGGKWSSERDADYVEQMMRRSREKKRRSECRLCKRIRRLVRNYELNRHVLHETPSGPPSPLKTNNNNNNTHNEINNNNNINETENEKRSSSSVPPSPLHETASFCTLTASGGGGGGGSSATCRFKSPHELNVELSELERSMWNIELIRLEEAHRLQAKSKYIVVEFVCSRVRFVQRHLKAFVDGTLFQRAILLAILINTLSMGIEHHDQAS